MDWNLILHVTLPMLAGFGWMILRFDKLNDKIQNIDSRLSRLEGKFDERGYWESREKKIGEK